jgi:ABC 3 transport family
MLVELSTTHAKSGIAAIEHLLAEGPVLVTLALVISVQTIGNILVLALLVTPAAPSRSCSPPRSSPPGCSPRGTGCSPAAVSPAGGWPC